MVSLFGNYFLAFFQLESIFFVFQQYPTPMIPVCWYAKSTPWVLNFCSFWVSILLSFVLHLLFCAIKMMFRVNSSASKMKCCFHSM